MGVLILLYSGSLFFKSSTLYVTMDRIVEENTKLIENSDTVMLNSRVIIPIQVNAVETLDISYYVNLDYQAKTGRLEATLTSDENVNTLSMKLIFESEMMQLYMMNLETNAYDLMMEEALIGSVNIMGALELIGNLEAEDFNREAVDIIENGKQIRTWGYRLKHTLEGAVLKEMLLKDAETESLSEELITLFNQAEVLLSESELELEIITDESLSIKSFLLTLIGPNQTKYHLISNVYYE